MIKLNEYDAEETRLNKNKTWYDPKNGSIISKEFSHRKYFSILSKYLPDRDYTAYFILLCDDKQNRASTRIDDYGRVKLFLNKEEIRLLGLSSTIAARNVKATKVDGDNDSELYEIEI
jgi:hypothetical protein